LENISLFPSSKVLLRIFWAFHVFLLFFLFGPFILNSSRCSLWVTTAVCFVVSIGVVWQAVSIIFFFIGVSVVCSFTSSFSLFVLNTCGISCSQPPDCLTADSHSFSLVIFESVRSGKFPSTSLANEGKALSIFCIWTVFAVFVVVRSSNFVELVAYEATVILEAFIIDDSDCFLFLDNNSGFVGKFIGWGGLNGVLVKSETSLEDKAGDSAKLFKISKSSWVVFWFFFFLCLLFPLFLRFSANFFNSWISSLSVLVSLAPFFLLFEFWVWYSFIRISVIASGCFFFADIIICNLSV